MSIVQPDLLTVVIPALNEEDAIGQTVARCLAARETIAAAVPGLGVEIIVVSDGSTDQTVSIAEGFPDIDVMVFAENRGYGAAIKAGFDHGSGDLVAFLDADGTCDPEFFADLCRAVVKGADVALGSRMGPDSEMPRLRRLGNRIFAGILSVLSRRSVGDSASGMRVIRRSALSGLGALPDGLHYTPAMSARALLQNDIQIVELPMSYSERVGQSKLSVGKDGLRFLGVILATVLTLRPARLLLLASLPSLVAAIAVSAYPIFYYINQGALLEWMVYRLLLSSLLAAVGAQLILGAAVAEKIAALAGDRRAASSGITGLLRPLFSATFSAIVGLALLLAGLLVVVPGIQQYLSSGEVTMHWSRAVLGALLASWSSGIAVTSLLLLVVELLGQSAHRSASEPPDRIRAAARETGRPH